LDIPLSAQVETNNDKDDTEITCDFTAFVNLTTLRINQIVTCQESVILALPPSSLTALDIYQYYARNENTQNWPATLTAIRVDSWNVTQSTAAARFPNLSHLSADANVNDLPATLITLKLPNFKLYTMDYDYAGGTVGAANSTNTIPPTTAWPSGLTRLDCRIVELPAARQPVVLQRRPTTERHSLLSLLPHSLTCLAGEWEKIGVRSYGLASFVLREPCAPNLTSLSISFGWDTSINDSETVATINPYLRVLVNLERLRLSRVSLRGYKTDVILCPPRLKVIQYDAHSDGYMEQYPMCLRLISAETNDGPLPPHSPLQRVHVTVRRYSRLMLLGLGEAPCATVSLVIENPLRGSGDPSVAIEVAPRLFSYGNTKRNTDDNDDDGDDHYAGIRHRADERIETPQVCRMASHRRKSIEASAINVAVYATLTWWHAPSRTRRTQRLDYIPTFNYIPTTFKFNGDDGSGDDPWRMPGQV
jgi:hypothetical protein